MNLREVLTGAVVMGPMTKGSNLPYRRLAVELGARVLVSEMTVARRLKQKRKSEFALIRALRTSRASASSWPAPIPRRWRGPPRWSSRAAPTSSTSTSAVRSITSRARAWARHSAASPRASAASSRRWRRRVTRVPVTVKIRLGWNDEMRNHVDLARAAVDGGAQAVFVHGRTRDARYRRAADWDAIGEVVAAVPVPVVGNGDLLFPHEVEAAARARRAARA